MDNSQTRFIITCAPRTGSTMLRMILDSHPDIVCYGEVITLKGNPNLGKKYQDSIQKTSEELAQIRTENPVNFLYNYVWHREDCKAIGLKLKYRQLEEQFKDIFEAVLEDKTVKVIHLTRKNFLKRYVSNRLAASGKTSTVVFDSEEDKSQPKVTVDVDKCIEDMKFTQEAEARFREHFQHHQVFEVAYEDLIESNTEIVSQLLNFLDVKSMDLKPVTEKVNSDRLEDIVENYDQVKETISSTKYANLL